MFGWCGCVVCVDVWMCGCVGMCGCVDVWVDVWMDVGCVDVWVLLFGCEKLGLALVPCSRLFLGPDLDGGFWGGPESKACQDKRPAHSPMHHRLPRLLAAADKCDTLTCGTGY